VKAGSLMSTDPTGRFDLPDHPLTRLYLLSSKQHGGAGDPTRRACASSSSTARLGTGPTRAVDRSGRLVDARHQPPDSEVPKLKDGTLVPPLPQSRMDSPTSPASPTRV